MSKEIRAEYGEMLMFPPCVEDWVGEDHPARFLREFVDSLELKGLGFREAKNLGRPRYSGDLLLKCWLYAYLNKIRSSRQLEQACREHVSLIWLTGNQTPDHNTLWRFWRKNRQALRKLFREVVKVAVSAGLVGLVLHAVDGTPIRAASSPRKGWYEKRLKKLLEGVESSIGKLEQEIEGAEKREKGEYRLPEELQEQEKLREAIVAAREQLRQSGQKALHPKEPEARMMRCDGKVQFGYNAQAMVDEASGLMVAEEVVNEAGDYHQLVPMLEATKENVGEVAQETVADRGYGSGASLSEAQEKGYEVLVGQEEGGAYAVSQFEYDPEHNRCRCPQGETLAFRGIRQKPGRAHSVRVFQCQSYGTCPVRWECSRSRWGRRVEISPYHRAIQRQREKQRAPDKQADLKRRQAIVERVFAQIKQHMGFRRWSVRGLDNVQTQWALLCTAYNLQRLYRHWSSGHLTFPP